MDPSSENPPQLDHEPLAPIEPTFSGNRILLSVINNSIWRYLDDEGNIIIDPSERITNLPLLKGIVTEENSKRDVDYDVPLDLPSIEELTKIARHEVEFGLNSLRSTGVITSAEAELASKFVSIHDIRVSPEGKGASTVIPMDVDDTAFPSDDESRPYIEFSENGIANMINHLKDVLEKQDVMLSEKDLLEVSLRAMGLHEWAHSFEKAAGIELYQKIIQSEGYDDDSQGWDALRQRRNIGWNSAREVVEPVIDGNDPNTEAEIHGERFASGIEFEALGQALIDKGVSPDKCGKIVRSILQRRSLHLAEYLEIMNDSGLTKEEFVDLCNDLVDVSRREKLPLNIIQPWSGLGYYAPYDAQSLRRIIQITMESIGKSNIVLDEEADEKDTVFEENIGLMLIQHEVEEENRLRDIQVEASQIRSQRRIGIRKRATEELSDIDD